MDSMTSSAPPPIEISRMSLEEVKQQKNIDKKINELSLCTKQCGAEMNDYLRLKRSQSTESNVKTSSDHNTINKIKLSRSIKIF
jgi:hypothetical protein